MAQREHAQEQTAAASAAAAAPDSSGEEVGEGEEVATELTVGSIWAKEGRKGVVDGEGKASTETAMTDGGARADSGR